MAKKKAKKAKAKAKVKKVKAKAKVKKVKAPAKAKVKVKAKAKKPKKPKKAAKKPAKPAKITAVGMSALNKNTTGGSSGPWGARRQTYPAPGMRDSLKRVQFGQGGAR